MLQCDKFHYERVLYFTHGKMKWGNLNMIRGKLKQNNIIRQEAIADNTQQLNRYVISQFFVKLVNFQQLIKAMKEMVGEDKKVKSSTLFDGIDMCLKRTIDGMLHDRYDVDAQTATVTAKLQENGMNVEDVKIKSLYPRLLKFSVLIDKPNTALMDGTLKREMETLFDESLKLDVKRVRNKKVRIDIKSSRRYKVDHGVTYIGKDKNKLTGDSYLCEDFQRATTMLAISDGMGNGEKAKSESSLALRIIKYLLSFDLDVSSAVRILADLKEQSNTDERFFSLDLCLIDKEKGQASFYKYAATSSFVLRGQKIFRVEMSGLPIGALEGDKLEKIDMNLQPDDTIILCSDGIIDVFSDLNLLERRIIKNSGMDVQSLSEDLLNYAIRRNYDKVSDDMMVVTAKYKTVR